MTLQEMRDYVRLYLDLDEEDLPDLIFDRFAEDGTSKILEREPYWPFLETHVDITPVVGQSDYDLTDFAPTLEFVTAVGPVDTALYHSYQWTAYTDIEKWGTVSQPRAWTTYGGTLYLVPAPVTDDLVRLTGVLAVSGWTTAGGGASPPLPDQFHSLVLEWTLASTYAQQDDLENTAMHQQVFTSRLEDLWRRWMTAPHTEGIRIGSAPRRPSVGGPVWPAGF